MERSPISYVENVTVPLLVIQGANDPRVVKAESDQMVEKMREKRFWQSSITSMIKSGHGPTNREERNKWMRMSGDFFANAVSGWEKGSSPPTKPPKREAAD